MNAEWLNQAIPDLKTALESRFLLEPAELEELLSIGKESLAEAIKSYIKKHGTKELEQIILQKMAFQGSELEKYSVSQLERDLKDSNLRVHTGHGIEAFSAGFLVDSVVRNFRNSGMSKDRDGICRFLGIDKNILKLINSPAGRILGKFF